LAAALARNPALKILSLNGYHDLATPFYQTELDLARLGVQPNLAIRHHQGGHMTYLDDISRPLEKADLDAFCQGVGTASAPRPRLEQPRPGAGPGPLPLLAVPAAGAAGGHPPLLRDSYVPPDQRHPRPGPPRPLQPQLERKLHPDEPE
jgi:hypothetical protein